MWPSFLRALAWMFRGSDSSAREHFDAVALTNRADFASVVQEWKAVAVELKAENADLRARIIGLEQREDELEIRERKCLALQFEHERRLARLENMCRAAGLNIE